jgi:radical SAM superfamily enzyme YgiQ (UPF0313 family)
MKITLLRPNFWNERSSDAMEPLALGLIAALTPPEHEIILMDERLEEIDFTHDTDLVAMTVETYTARRAYEIAAKFRKRGIPVVMGGYHPTMVPDEARIFADSVVIGDAEGLWKQILEDVHEGTLQPVYQQDEFLPLGDYAPDRSIFNGKKYVSLQPVYYGRGCRYACDFCSIYSFYKSHLRQRPLSHLIAEIESLPSRYIFFIDDNLFVNPQVTRDFLHAMKPLNRQWSCQVSIDIAQNPELLDLMAESGCILILIGFESLNSQNLRQMKKAWNVKNADYSTVIRQIQERGIMIYGTFVFGYDHDTRDSFKRTVDFALENKFCLANFNPLTPMPGSQLYARLQKEGRLIYDRWWLDSRFRYGDATFVPVSMTPDELTEGCYWARSEFNTATSILKRSLDRKANARNLRNMGVYWLSNLISRREIHTKQGRRLGSSSDWDISERLCDENYIYQT